MCRGLQCTCGAAPKSPTSLRVSHLRPGYPVSGCERRTRSHDSSVHDAPAIPAHQWPSALLCKGRDEARVALRKGGDLSFKLGCEIYTLRPGWRCTVQSKNTEFKRPTGWHKVRELVEFTSVCRRRGTGSGAGGFQEMPPLHLGCLEHGSVKTSASLLCLRNAGISVYVSRKARMARP